MASYKIIGPWTVTQVDQFLHSYNSPYADRRQYSLRVSDGHAALVHLARSMHLGCLASQCGDRENFAPRWPLRFRHIRRTGAV